MSESSALSLKILPSLKIFFSVDTENSSIRKFCHTLLEFQSLAWAYRTLSSSSISWMTLWHEQSAVYLVVLKYRLYFNFQCMSCQNPYDTLFCKAPARNENGFNWMSFGTYLFIWCWNNSMKSIFELEQISVMNFLADSSDCCPYSCLGCNGLIHSSDALHILWSPRGNHPVGLSRAGLLASLLYHIFQCLNLEPSHPNRRNYRFSVWKSSIFLKNRTLWNVSSFWARVSVQQLIKIHFYECLIIQVI